MPDHREIAEQLRARLEALQRRTDKVENSLRRERDHDSQERAQEMENDEVLAQLDEGGLEEIAQIRAALTRIDNGTYGECESCGEEISTGRLGALPYARQCIDCAS